MKKRLKDTLSEALGRQSPVNVYNSYDIVGDIAIIRLTEASKGFCQEIAEAIMRVHRNVKTVLAQTSAVRGDFRLRELRFVAGENRTVTRYREWGCLFSVDVRECYFSPRLSFERMRIARQVGNGEVVLNMFAGVGCFSILIAKYSNAERVYSIDANPSAVRYMQENVRMNRVYGRVSCLLGDAKRIVERSLCHTADRVLMPLPEKAFEYSRKREDVVEKVSSKVAQRLHALGASFNIPLGRIVRSIGPNWYQVVLDIEVLEPNRIG